MTGYGKCTVVFQGKKITAEIKSLNSKALDLSTRIAPLYREKEMEIRNLIAATLERGKVEFNLWTEKEEQDTELPLDAALLGSYYRQIMTICREQNIPEPANPWLTLLRMPDVFNRQEAQNELSEEEWAVVLDVVKQAVQHLVDFRIQEGAALQKKFEEKLHNISELLAQIAPFEEQRTEKIRQRLTDALAAIPNVDYDRNRLEQEMIYYIEKLDINEEKQRLTNHLKYFQQTMDEGHGQGKKLGFIAQEMAAKSTPPAARATRPRCRTSW